jgi:hypothetical protein
VYLLICTILVFTILVLITIYIYSPKYTILLAGSRGMFVLFYLMISLYCGIEYGNTISTMIMYILYIHIQQFLWHAKCVKVESNKSVCPCTWVDMATTGTSMKVFPTIHTILNQ